MERVFNRDKIPLYLMALTQGKLPGSNLPQRQMSLPSAPRLPDPQPAEKLDPKALMNLIKLMRGEDQTRPEDHKNPPPEQPPEGHIPDPWNAGAASPGAGPGGVDLNSAVEQMLAGNRAQAMGDPQPPQMTPPLPPTKPPPVNPGALPGHLVAQERLPPPTPGVNQADLARLLRQFYQGGAGAL